jgi:hypothetical protein
LPTISDGSLGACEAAGVIAVVAAALHSTTEQMQNVSPESAINGRKLEIHKESF